MKKGIILFIVLALVIVVTGCGSVSKTDMVKAVNAGDKAAIEKYLAKGYEINNTEGNNEESLIVLAVRAGHWEIVKLLIDSGADSISALDTAIKEGNWSIVSLLLENTAVHSQNQLVELAMNQAIKCRNFSIAQRLFPKVNSKETINTILKQLIVNNDTDMFKALIETRNPLAISEEYLTSLLLYLIETQDNAQIAEILVQNGANINENYYEGYDDSLFDVAYSRGQYAIAKFLFDAGVRVHPDNWGYIEFNSYIDMASAGQVGSISNEEVLTMVSEANHRYWRAFLGYSSDENARFYKGDMEYIFFSEEIDTKEEYMSYLEEVYTKEVSQSIFDKCVFGEKDGRLYRGYGDIGSITCWDLSLVKLIEISPDDKVRKYAFLVPVSDYCELQFVELLQTELGWRVNTLIED